MACGDYRSVRVDVLEDKKVVKLVWIIEITIALTLLEIAMLSGMIVATIIGSIAHLIRPRRYYDFYSNLRKRDEEFGELLKKIYLTPIIEELKKAEEQQEERIND